MTLPPLFSKRGSRVSNLPCAPSETKRIKTTVDERTDGERDEGQTHESKRGEGPRVLARFHARFTTHKYSTAHLASEKLIIVAKCSLIQSWQVQIEM